MDRRLLILYISSLIVVVGTTGGVATTVHVQSGSALAAAISDSAVDRIIVDGPIRFEAGDFSSDTPIRLTRNLTITSDAAGPHQVLLLIGGGKGDVWQRSVADCACQRNIWYQQSLILSF